MLTAEEKYRLLLQVSEAASSQIEIAAVLEAVVEGLEPAIHVKALAVTTIEDGAVVPHALYIQGVERRQGDSFADIISRWISLSGAEMPPKPHGSLPLAGTGSEYGGRHGRAFVCDDLAQGVRFPEDARLLAAGVRSYVRVPLKVHDRLIGSPPLSPRRPRPLSPPAPHRPLPPPGRRRLRGARPADRRRRGQRPGLRGDRAAQPPAPGREPGPAPGDRRTLDVRGDHRLLAGPARDPGPRGQGGGDRHHGADHRRDRHRQGAGGAGHPPAVEAVAPGPGGGELRGPPCLPDRLRAVRPREGGVRRHPAAPRRPLRAGGGRVDLPGRGGRAAARGAGLAAARAPGRDL